jgi:hypothetical protein
VNDVPVDPPPVPDDALTYVFSTADTCTVAVTDSIGLSQSATVTVLADDPDIPLEITPLSVTVEPNGAATFMALGGTGDYTFTVASGGAGGTISDTNPAIYTAPSSSGSDTVSLSDGLATVTAAVTVIDPAAAPLSLSPQNPTVSAIGDRIQFEAFGGSGTGGWTYTFSTNKPGTGFIDPLTGSYEQLKEGHVVVTVRDGAGATANTLVKFLK